MIDDRKKQMTPFSMELMEDIMCLTSFSSHHNDVETAKPVYNCWGRRRFLVHVENARLPDVAYHSLEPDLVRLPDKQRKIAAKLSYEPLYGKGRARILKDHPLADGINSWNTIRPPLNEDVDDVDPDRFQCDFDSAIQAECAEFGTAHFVDALPSLIDSDDNKENNLVKTKHVEDWLVNNDHIGAVRAESPRYARKIRYGRSCSNVHKKPFKTYSSNHYSPKDGTSKNNFRHAVESNSSKDSSSGSQEPYPASHKSDSSLVNSHNDIQKFSQCEKVSSTVLEISKSQDALGFSNGPVMNVTGTNIYVSDEEEKEDNDHGCVLEKLNPKESNNPFPGFPMKDNIIKTSNYLPAGYERNLAGRGLNGDTDPNQPNSSDDEQEEDDFTCLKKGGNVDSMYANPEIPTARVTFGDYIFKTQKLKSASKASFKGKSPALDPQLREEFFPDLPSSQPSCSEPSASSTEEVLSFNMKDLAATLLGSSQGLKEKVEDFDKTGHGDVATIAGKFLEIDGLPEGVAANELKEYLEMFGEVFKVDFFPSICGKGARVFMQDTQVYEWIMSCLNGVACPIGDAPEDSFLTLKIME